MTILTAATNGPDTSISLAPKATIGIVVTPEQLADAHGATIPECGTALPQSTIDRFYCDAAIYRTVMSNGSELLDLGREVRTATATQKKALVIRDRGCIVPGCTCPPRWCEAHHVVWYRNGGHTTITNLVLLCRRHHTQLHAGYWSIVMRADQTYEFRRRDGTAFGGSLRCTHAPPGELSRN